MIALSLGIPFGLITGMVGVILYFATNYKKTAMVIIGIGALITILTFILILLAVASQM